MSTLAGLADSTGFELLDPSLARDALASVELGLSNGALFDAGPDPLAIFRQGLRTSIYRIETDQRQFDLFRRFLLDGPYEREGSIPSGLISQRLSDDETAAAIRFIYYRVINTFQGFIAELLAVGPCVRLIQDLQTKGCIPEEARIFVGDSIWSKTRSPSRMAKGADIHILIPDPRHGGRSARLAGLAEVKSYALSQSRLLNQIERHIFRAADGVSVRANNAASGRLNVFINDKRRIIRIGVVPATWHLPRTFRFEAADGKKRLSVDPPVPPSAKDRIEPIDPRTWRLTLRWSHEALASAAYEMTFWLMGELGKAIYTIERPSPWPKMICEEAGRNAAKMMLYYAIPRCRTAWESRRTIALYNAYGFGYALGANLLT
jgi:hypothetical protein